MQSTTPGDGSIRSGLSSLVRSAEGVYGLILVAGMIVVSRNLTGTSAQALLSVVVTLVVFFAACDVSGHRHSPDPRLWVRAYCVFGVGPGGRPVPW